MKDPIAILAAELGSLAFRTTYARWVDPTNQQNFAEVASQRLRELRAATATVG